MAFVRSVKGHLLISLPFRGQQVDQYLGLKDNPTNRQAAQRRARKIARAMSEGTFDFMREFPNASQARLIKLGLIDPPAPKVQKLGAAVREWLEEKAVSDIRPQSLYVYQHQLDHVLGHDIASKPLDQIDDKTITRFLGDLKTAGVGSTQRAAVFARLKTIFDSARRHKVIPTEPTESMDSPQVIKPAPDSLSIAEARAIIATAQGQERHLVVAAIYLGLRPGELFSLKWSDVDFDRGIVSIERTQRRKIFGGGTGPTKTKGSTRRIRMGVAVTAALHAQEKLSPFKAGYIFPSPAGGMILSDGWRQGPWRRLLARAGVSGKRTLMVTRHTLAALTMEHSEAPQSIAQVLGHGDTTMVNKVYAQWNLDRLGTASMAMDRILAEPNSGFSHDSRMAEGENT